MFKADISFQKQQLTLELAGFSNVHCLPIGYRALIRQRAA
jgi:hypothetical protein